MRLFCAIIFLVLCGPLFAGTYQKGLIPGAKSPEACSLALARSLLSSEDGLKARLYRSVKNSADRGKALGVKRQYIEEAEKKVQNILNESFADKIAGDSFFPLDDAIKLIRVLDEEVDNSIARKIYDFNINGVNDWFVKKNANANYTRKQKLLMLIPGLSLVTQFSPKFKINKDIVPYHVVADIIGGFAAFIFAQTGVDPLVNAGITMGATAFLRSLSFLALEKINYTRGIISEVVRRQITPRLSMLSDSQERELTRRMEKLGFEEWMSWYPTSFKKTSPSKSSIEGKVDTQVKTRQVTQDDTEVKTLVYTPVDAEAEAALFSPVVSEFEKTKKVVQELIDGGKLDVEHNLALKEAVKKGENLLLEVKDLKEMKRSFSSKARQDEIEQDVLIVEKEVVENLNRIQKLYLQQKRAKRPDFSRENGLIDEIVKADQ